ncbi:hypothetical protein TREMEDRAFT_58268 [Tremella mesenterica DSM 1558]|uniref:uncharacterized protein n=1 Tax=Tremella mesenterica (strain ATCC 24925 / CBS 8224 / DSM 1558 / NBRC 9311 / NRRL Y-6157 / RJB 2259-6 / UBC 559-6) TaxID=578456 RepID=UPI0003F499E9|nr:uncharacterized protein TREMEDRAFT_58268 [Tremella mesenterica DSM 1558]EIW72114.1 hypothetical protein TREMEDRAFT_58268 [Tremella mesenterica DSM 1558]
METPSLGLPSICAGTDVDTDVNVPWWTFTSIGYPFAFEEPFSHVVEERPAFLDDLRCILPNGTVGKGDDGKSLEAFNRANQSHDPVPDWANGYLQLVSESVSESDLAAWRSIRAFNDLKSMTRLKYSHRRLRISDLHKQRRPLD